MKSMQAEKEIAVLIERYPVLSGLRNNLILAAETIIDAIKNGNKVLVCGNGGSAADSMHIVGELMKGFMLERKLTNELQKQIQQQFPDEADYYIKNLQQPIPAISLVNEVALTTAFSNDKCADLVMAQQVLGSGRRGDVLIAISTSGNSANIVHAAKIASVLGLKIISLTGTSGGELANITDILLAVPAQITYQIQELHLPVYHALCLAVEKELFLEK